MASGAEYGEIVKQAEAAVAGIKDAELKGIAFGKVLDTLLGQRTVAARYAKGPSRESPRSSKRKEGSEQARPAKQKRGPKAYVKELIGEEFFNTPKTLAAVRAELGNRGHHIPITSLSGTMMSLCQERQLRRQKAKDGKKEIYTYARW